MNLADIEINVLFNGNVVVSEDQAPLITMSFNWEAEALNEVQKLDIAREATALMALHLGWLPKPEPKPVSLDVKKLKIDAIRELMKQDSLVDSQFLFLSLNVHNKQDPNWENRVLNNLFNNFIFPNPRLRERYATIKRHIREAINESEGRLTSEEG